MFQAEPYFDDLSCPEYDELPGYACQIKCRTHGCANAWRLCERASGCGHVVLNDAQTWATLKSAPPLPTANCTGRAPEACACGIDYSTMLRAVVGKAAHGCTGNDAHELSKALQHGSRRGRGAPFEPSGRCVLRWFSRAEACDVVGRAGKVLFDGSSLTRELITGVWAVLSGDYERGGVSLLPRSFQSPRCSCRTQYACGKHASKTGGMTMKRLMPFHGSEERAALPQWKLCPTWTREHIVSYEYTVPIAAMDVTRTRGAWGRTVLVSELSAPNVNLNLTRATESVLAARHALHEPPLLPHGPNYHSGWDALIPMTVHWPGPHKPAAYLETQGQTAVQRYNRGLREWARRGGAGRHDAVSGRHDDAAAPVWVLETYAFTEGLHSHDGLHYQESNVVIAQLLFNLLDHLQRTKALPPLREARPADTSTFARHKPGRRG